MIRTDPDHNQRQETTQTTKSYVFHVPITTANYKAAPFDYQVVNQASMTMVGGITRSGQVYDQNKKEVLEGIQQQHPELGK